MKKTLVIKLGGASLATPTHFHRAAELIINKSTEYQKMVIVVSAMANKTDQLIQLAKEVNPNPPQREYDMLVTSGERMSIALLAMALAARDFPAISFTGSQSGIITCDRHTEARIIDVRPHRIVTCLEEKKAVIVAGFQGVSKKNEITTLGRGGSDTTAVALGVALEADRVEFYKDVDGVYAEDPKQVYQMSPFKKLSYAQALDIVNKGAKILHARCVDLAYRNQLPLWVGPYEGWSIRGGTLIADEFAERLIEKKYEEIS